MSAILTSTLVVAVAEIGDKTQLLAFVLASRFKNPLAIIAGILFATLANHGLAAFVGISVAGLLDGDYMRWILGASFLAMAVWTLIPDKLDDDEAPKTRYGAFLATLISFFLVEIGDKTQVATVALAAQYHSILHVTAGTTLGMMIANVPVVLTSHKLAPKLPLRTIRLVAALIFLILGIVTLSPG